MRRRSRPKVVWLPQSNVFSVDAGATGSWNFVSVTVNDAGASGDGGVIEVPIVLDGNQSDPLDPTSSLADIESSGYRLRRIVGKLYCFIAQNAVLSTSLIGVTAGFIIRRVDPSTGGSLAAAASAATAFDQIDPAKIDNDMDPWIWRRSWLLGNSTATTGVPGAPLSNTDFFTAFNAAPGTNYGRSYPGGNLEGPHVDQKTARIVGPEERLFLDVSATTILPSSDASRTTSLILIYEFRVLASMRQNIGNRRNASR